MKSLLILSLLFGFTACEKSDDYVYYSNPPKVEKQSKVYPLRSILRNAEIDILWVIDNSGSMSSIQQNIVRNAALFMQEFTQNNYMKWKMGIMSTDKNEDPYLGFTSPFDNQTVDPVTQFRAAVNRLGTNGSASEYVFYNTLRSMLDPRMSKFFRKNAHLAVIMVTDEQEQSEDDFGKQYEYINFLNTVQTMRDPSKIIRFYGAFSFRDLQNCGSYDGNYVGSAYDQIITETSGIHMSACTKDFGNQLAAIGKDIISIVDSPSILLGYRPVLETIKVLFDGKELQGGDRASGGYWYYNRNDNTIEFYNLNFVPDFSTADIKVEFDIDDGIDRDEEEL